MNLSKCSNLTPVLPPVSGDATWTEQQAKIFGQFTGSTLHITQIQMDKAIRAKPSIGFTD